MLKRHWCGLQSRQNFQNVQGRPFGSLQDVRMVKEQNDSPIFKQRLRNYPETSLNPILNIPKTGLPLKEDKNVGEKESRHHSNPITIRNQLKCQGRQDERKGTKLYSMASLKIPQELQRTIQMMHIEKAASIERSKHHQPKGQRFSHNCLKQNSQIARKTRLTYMNAISQLESRECNQNFLKINVSKFKSQKWKVFKKKKYAHSDILSIKPSKINKNSHHIRQPSSFARKEAIKIELHERNQILSKNRKKQSDQDDNVQQIQGFSPWSNTLD